MVFCRLLVYNGNYNTDDGRNIMTIGQNNSNYNRKKKNTNISDSVNFSRRPPQKPKKKKNGEK